MTPLTWSPNKREHPKIFLERCEEEFERECCFCLLPAGVCVYYSGGGLGGKLVLLMKITSCENKWTVNASHKELHTCFFFFFCQVLTQDESCLVWIIFSPFVAVFCPLPGLWAVLSLHERNSLKWRNTSMSPFPPLLHKWLYNWFFSPPTPPPPPPVPAIGAVITIYLGSLFHYSKTRGKVQCFMIYGGYLTCAY